MSLLILRDVVIRLGGRTLLDGASLAIGPGQRVGLVGRNGTGKSTLLRAIAGDLALDGGEIRLAARARIGTVRAAGAGRGGEPARHGAAGRP